MSRWIDIDDDRNCYCGNNGEYERWNIDPDVIGEARDTPHWIPITERMPEYGTEVVTINKDDEYEINHVIDEEDGEWFWDGAVAWMPLPHVYKEKE